MSDRRRKARAQKLTSQGAPRDQHRGMRVEVRGVRGGGLLAVSPSRRPALLCGFRACGVRLAPPADAPPLPRRAVILAAPTTRARLLPDVRQSVHRTPPA